jgi:hypothetical protein
MTQPDLDNTEPSRLASIVDLDPSAQRLWEPDELAEILRHQLSVSVRLDPAAVNSGQNLKPQTLVSPGGMTVDSFAELLAHPDPPIELLIKLKDFAKANAAHPDSALPADVSKVLYYLAISVALLRCRRRITSMSDTDLAASLKWATDLPWLEPRERSILEEAAGRFKPPT